MVSNGHVRSVAFHTVEFVKIGVMSASVLGNAEFTLTVPSEDVTEAVPVALLTSAI